MTHWLRSVLSKADALPPRLLLWVNLVLAALVVLAHGGALLALRAQPVPNAPDIESLAKLSLPLAGLVLLSAAAALLAVKLRRLVLGLHGTVFLAAAVAELVWGVGLLLEGIPAGNFSWSVGLFSLSVAYSTFIFSRFAVPIRFRASAPAFYLPALALMVAIPIDFGVIMRLASELNARFGS